MHLCLAAIAAATACGKPPPQPDLPPADEPVPDLKHDEADQVLARAGQLSSIQHRGKTLTEPPGGPLREDEVPMTAGSPDVSRELDAPGARSTIYYPDRQTSLDGELPYYDVFTPSIAPFKRVSAFDRVVLGSDGLTPGLTTSNGPTSRVPVESEDAPPPDPRARDRFWGSVVLDFAAGERVPLPSVSPESRLLKVTTEPTIAIRFERDSADNYAAVHAGNNVPSQVRLTFMTDAPQVYFGAELPDVRADSLRAELPRLAPSIQARAELFASELGIQASDPLRDVLSALTAHFRSFEESRQPPKNTGDTYLDLARGKKGICRHRAYAFVVTAQALGIPTRFVQNEAHSWVEVKVPTVGWLRIDLGGSAHGLNARNHEDKPTYEPSEPDRLPQPLAYQTALAEAAAHHAQQRAEAAQAREHLGAGNVDQATGQWVKPDHDAPATNTAERTGVGLSERAPSADDARNKQALLIRLDRGPESTFRGSLLPVSGRVTNEAGEPVANLRIEVALGAKRSERKLLLGVTISGEDGYFQRSFGVPNAVDVGEYTLLVMTPGNDDYLPAVAR